MKVKFDENLPASALIVARELGHDADSVNVEGLIGASDDEVLTAATRNGRLLITLDRGFGDVRARPPGTHGGIAVLRLDSEDAVTATDAVRSFLTRAQLDELAGCVVVVRGNLVRVRRPE